MPLNPPDIKELKAIVDWVNLTEDVRELSIRYGDVELFVSRNRNSSAPAAPAAAPALAAAPAPVAALPAPAPAPAAAPALEPAASASAPAAPAPASSDGLAADEVIVKAPMVGTFYAAPKPGDPPFVEVGRRVEPGTVLCIVEVMKLMNNIEATETGVVTRILVENNQTVEYGQPMMVIKRDA